VKRGLAGCLLLVVACNVGRMGAAPREGAAPAMPAEAARPDAGVDAGTPADADAQASLSPTVQVELPGYRLSRYEPWQPPGAAHPNGTLIAIAYKDSDSSGPLLVEIDIRGTVVGSHGLEVEPGSKVRMMRAGDLLHVGVQQPRAFVWITYDLSLSEQRRLTLPGMAATQLHYDY
jgi:hypothetical protein